MYRCGRVLRESSFTVRKKWLSIDSIMCVTLDMTIRDNAVAVQHEFKERL